MNVCCQAIDVAVVMPRRLYEGARFKKPAIRKLSEQCEYPSILRFTA